MQTKLLYADIRILSSVWKTTVSTLGNSEESGKKMQNPFSLRSMQNYNVTQRKISIQWRNRKAHPAFLHWSQNDDVN